MACLAAIVMVFVLVREAACRSLPGSILDDPHFTSPDGIPYDFHGEMDRAFCLSSDDSFHINAMLRGYKDSRPFGFSAPDAQGLRTRTWMKELGFLWVDARGAPHVLHLAVRVGKQAARGRGYLAKLSLDGKAIRPPYDGKPVEQAGLILRFVGVEQQEKPKEEREQFEISIENEFGGMLTLRPANPQLQTKTDAEVHFNLSFWFLNSTEHVHGVMGQTYRTTPEQMAKSKKFGEIAMKQNTPIQADQKSGKGFLDGTVADYISSDVTKADCKFSQYHL